ncbi:hypothetical protein [Aridibaculum aurantiacum]|uniref:hypothetical protein n=1 Tax=Aridibaculum aurantiacum TaxID=2810307 RepID=UPI001A96E412|nr:hypothetical protein [Aridibaculum aurantiacum]
MNAFAIKLLLSVIAVIALIALLIIISKRNQKRRKKRIIRPMDIVMLRPSLKQNFPDIPLNNPMTVVEVNAEEVEVRYHHFKLHTLHTARLPRKAVVKVS